MQNKEIDQSQSGTWWETDCRGCENSSAISGALYFSSKGNFSIEKKFANVKLEFFSFQKFEIKKTEILKKIGNKIFSELYYELLLIMQLIIIIFFTLTYLTKKTKMPNCILNK